jgi:hypothetical protein
MNKKEPITCEYLLDNQFCKSVNEDPEHKVVRTDFCTNSTKNYCCYLCSKREDCEIGCSYLETTEKMLNDPESETTMSDGPPILETERGTLTKSFFNYDGQTYKISDMTRASITSGFWKAPALLIDFKDGTQKKFKVWSIDKESHANLLFTGGVVDTLTKDQASSTQQWVKMINLLIGLQMK